MQKCRSNLSAINRKCKFTGLERWGVLMKSFLESQFAHCPLVWMCCDKTSDRRINHLDKLALRYDLLKIHDIIFCILQKKIESQNGIVKSL